MPNRNRNIPAGLILVTLGAVFLLMNTLDRGWHVFWPLLVIAAGFAFLAGFLKNRAHYGLLMPATLLVLYGLLFLFCSLTDWSYMSQLWPVFILGPGLGFLAMYWGGPRETGILIPAFILIALAMAFFIFFGPFNIDGDYWPVLLILLGIFLIWSSRRNLREQP